MSKLSDALQVCLEELERGDRSPDEVMRAQGAPEEVGPLLRAAARYRRAPAVRPSRAFRAAARGRMLELIAAADGAPIPPAPVPAVAVSAPRRTEPRPSRPLPFRRSAPLWLARVAAILAAVLLLGGLGTAAVVAASPESPLHEVRLAVEQAHLALARDDEERATLRREQAERRAAELADLARRRSMDGLERGAQRYEETARAAVDDALRPTVSPDAPSRLERHLATQAMALAALAAALDEGDSAGRDRLGETVGVIQRERARLRVGLPSEVSPPEEAEVPGGEPRTAEQDTPALIPPATNEDRGPEGERARERRAIDAAATPVPAATAPTDAGTALPAEPTLEPRRERSREQGTPSPIAPTAEAGTVTATPTAATGGSGPLGPTAATATAIPSPSAAEPTAEPTRTQGSDSGSGDGSQPGPTSPPSGSGGAGPSGSGASGTGSGSSGSGGRR